MPTRTTTRRATATGRRQAAPRARRTKSDALSLLKSDHERVDAMFRRYERMKEGDERKEPLQRAILGEVRVHAQVEEELFYPALRSAIDEDGGSEKDLLLIAEADTEHETVKWLMAEIDGGESDATSVDARMKVMGEYIRHHVKEEEGPIFRLARRSGIDLDELGAQMRERKQALAPEEAPEQRPSRRAH